MRKLVIFLTVIFLGLMLAGVASAVTDPEPANSNAVVTQGAQISGNNIVYQQEYSGTDHDIYKKDLVTGSITSVTTSTRDDQDPHISGNIVVWRSLTTGGKWQIYWKNTSTNNPEALVHANPSVDQFCPRISGNYVVWQQYFGPHTADTGVESGYPLEDYDIVGYNLATNTYYPSIASSKQYEDAPEIYGNTVVYYKYVNLGTVASPKWRTQVYKTTFGTTNEGQRIHANTNDQTGAVVSRSSKSSYKAAWIEQSDITGIHYIVWVENLWAASPIFHTISTGLNDNQPAICGNILVWTKQKSFDNWDIVMKDISNSHNFITNVENNLYDQRDPVVGVSQYGIFVAYIDSIDGYDRVYWRNMDKISSKAIAGNPARGAVNVLVNKVITTTFSEPIKAGNMGIELVSSSGTVVPITTSINGKVLTITPAILLKKATKYTIMLHTGSITDYAGNPLSYYYRSFTTDSTSPKATSGSPARNAVKVASNALIITTFNEPIKEGNMWIRLVNSSGKPVAIYSYVEGNSFVIVPVSSLAKSTKYTLILHTGCITDWASNRIAYYYRSFTTGTT